MSLSDNAKLFYFDEDYQAAKEFSQVQLESADVAALTKRAKEIADAKNLLLPDADALLERCIVALLGGHIVLQGPPGTGKTTLAYVLAETFNATAHLETATADWSTYDVIGGLHPTSNGGIETLVPWLGHVPRAALECASVISRHADAEERKTQPYQAHWLIIDEFSRAEIDKAIGPLYTVLGGGGDDVPLPLWFGDSEERSAVWLPKRFRIIATMNTVDTNYVYTFSQGLSRRFQFVYVGVPQKEQLEAELEQARISAAKWYDTAYGGQQYKDTYAGQDFKVDDFVANAKVAHATSILLNLLSALRYGDEATNRPGWPLGTAQVVDVYRQLALRLPATGDTTDALLPALDLALADRIIPQAGNLTKVQLDATEAWLQAQKLPRTLDALQHLRMASSTGY
ncbi:MULTISPECIES: AAA family ATPase [Paenarthrobacter]|uniref:AAA family ATPase n=1 Tax=Paenarthrobacter ureafaciens TaxID=37931 RepID=A0AAX3ERQ4_PAEUR|nr:MULTISPECIES: AAA family ATPase [Paenarthrobacter]NKR10543.1 ATPase [Arthrobacter sp. M5]NKR15220.1 ATPase [Arthrobacter sp. M6]OEH61549.1 ATPase [Arthrobacter sp. D2]OEH61608.1 ATPase [Arthrobacter sp. D4]MDO5867046.1 AAA family ATPase [Paenarthrobacter sp. SD-2]